MNANTIPTVAQADAVKFSTSVRVAIASPLGARVRKRRVEGPRASRWADLAREARDAGEWRYEADHGGTVANAYKYQAWTETVLAVASPDGDVVLWYGQQSANKATLTLTVTSSMVGSRARRAAKRAARFTALATPRRVRASRSPQSSCSI